MYNTCDLKKGYNFGGAMFCNVQNNYRLRDFDPFDAEQVNKKKIKI